MPLNSISCFPQSFTAPLTYVDTLTDLDHIGFNYLARSLRLNGPFDPEPLILGGTPTGFVQWAAIFRHYLVLSAYVEWTVTNKEAFPVTLYMAPTDTNFTSSVTTKELAQAVGELPMANTAVISMAGGQDRAVLRRRIDLGRLIGSPAKIRADDLYSSLVNAVPANTLYQLFTCTADSVFVNGISCITKLIMETKFYGRQSPII